MHRFPDGKTLPLLFARLPGDGRLRQAGVPAPLCVGVHALFAPDAMAQLEPAGVKRVVSCDSVPHPSNAIGLSGLVARAVCKLAGPVPDLRCRGGSSRPA